MISFLLVTIFVVVFLVIVLRLSNDLTRLQNRLDHVEADALELRRRLREQQGFSPDTHAAETPAASTETVRLEAAPFPPLDVPGLGVYEAGAGSAPELQAAPHAIRMTAVSPGAPTPTPASLQRAPSADKVDGRTLEQLVGGIWLQNVGSVLLLLGVFLMIVWGYRTGRVGPGVLVASGVALGLAFVWRGDRIARSVAAFGHALIGVGLGVVYISLYLGHFQLGVLSVVPAFAMLTIVSLVTMAIGRRYGVPTIAALGVIGAFVPQWVPLWTSMQSFGLPPGPLLAYLALVDGIVFALALTAGWSGLDLAALILTAGTWAMRFTKPDWDWNIQLGLTALFVSLGLAPLPFLVRQSARIRNLDLAVIAFAPLCYLAASGPMLMYANRRSVSMLLLGLVAVHVTAASWVHRRREHPDLWRVLTGAAVLYLTFAVERAVGTEQTHMAWTIEGLVLIAIGTRAGGGWMRLCGSIVAALGVMGLIGDVDFLPSTESRGAIMDADDVRVLVCAAGVLLTGYLLARRRSNLSPREAWAPEIWTAVGNVLLMAWVGREARVIAAAIELPGAGDHPPPPGVSPWARSARLSMALTSAVWMIQAFVLIMAGSRGLRKFPRLFGTVVAACAWIVLVASRFVPDGWRLDRAPILHLPGLLELLGIILAVVVATRIGSVRVRLSRNERWLPETWAFGAVVALLIWSSTESAHLALTLVDLSGPPNSLPDADHIATLRASLTSGAWIVEAVALLVVGWWRNSAFLRWCGLALFGVTLLKFALFDLRKVDVFWRFLTAIAVGAAMLAISYAYQARARARSRRAEAEANPRMS